MTPPPTTTTRARFGNTGSDMTLLIALGATLEGRAFGTMSTTFSAIALQRRATGAAQRLRAATRRSATRSARS